jgi:hypothetical protein
MVLEKRLPADPGTAYPVCRGDEGACPPEDCVGVLGFYDLLDALGEPTQEAEEQQDWVGDDRIPTLSLSWTSTRYSPLRVVAEEILHAVGHQPVNKYKNLKQKVVVANEPIPSASETLTTNPTPRSSSVGFSRVSRYLASAITQ